MPLQDAQQLCTNRVLRNVRAINSNSAHYFCVFLTKQKCQKRLTLFDRFTEDIHLDCICVHLKSPLFVLTQSMRVNMCLVYFACLITGGFHG